MAVFEYWYRFAVDEELIPRYNKGSAIKKFVFEFRINFVVKPIEEEGEEEEEAQKTIEVGSERYGLVGFYEEMGLRDSMRFRLMDYWMPDDEIRRLINEALLFGKEGGVRRPTVVDLDVCTLQQEGESIDATLDRAMRPDHVKPLYLRNVIDPTNPDPNYADEIIDFMENGDMLMFLDIRLSSYKVTVKVKNEAVRQRLISAHAMPACGVCGGEPFLGCGVSTLRCGHAFHYHCIVRRLRELDGFCPICHLRAYDLTYPSPMEADRQEVRLLFSHPPPNPPPQQEEEKEGVFSIINEYY